MPFERIAIWGLGLMGGSLAAALKAREYQGTIVAISSPDTLSKAGAAGLIDAAFAHDDYADGVAGADLVVLSSPIASIIENLERLAAVLEHGVVVTDVGSTKKAIADRAREVLPASVEFIGGHPMTGSERRGLEAADASLYENAVWVLTPDPDSRAVDRLAALAASVGARAVVTDPGMHDRIAARISHLPQILAVTLMNVAGDWNAEDDLTLQMAAGGFRDSTRIASSPFEVWSDIIATNRTDILEALDTYIHELEALRPALAHGSLQSRFERANRLRRSQRQRVI